MHTAVEHREQCFHCGEADAGESAGERVETQQHDRAHRLCRQGLARTAGVAHDQVSLQFLCVLIRYAFIGEFAKSGGEAIDCISALEHRLNMRTRVIDGDARFRRDLRLFAQA